MSERPDLQQLVEAAGVPAVGISVATQVIAESAPADLIHAVRSTEISAFSAEMAIKMAPLLDAMALGTILKIANQEWGENPQEGYAAQAGALQDLASDYYKMGRVPPASVLNAIFTAQEEAENYFPGDMAETLVEPAIESLKESQEAAEQALERADELNEDLELAHEIVRLRQRFARGRRLIAIGIVSLTLGGALGGLKYEASNEYYDSLKQPEKYGLTKPALTDSGTELAAGIGTLGGAMITALFTVTGDGFVGRAARRKARRLVKKAQTG